MKKESLTSEEKLLRLIQKKDKPDTSKSSDKKNKNNLEKKRGGKLSRDTTSILMSVNKVLLVIVVILIGIIVYQKFFVVREDIKLDVNVKASSSKVYPVKQSENINPFIFYEEKIKDRDIFQAPWEKEKIKIEENSQVSQPIAQINLELKLVGIIIDQDPKAIIEDTKDQQTYFVSVGEEIGGAVLEEIQEEKVILNYNNKMIELSR